MPNIYFASDMSGGGDGDMDSISVTDATGDGSGVALAQNDICIVAGADAGYAFFVMQDSAGAVEDGEFCIIPDDNTSTLWWKRIQTSIPQGSGVYFFGTTMPTGWANPDGSTVIYGDGQLIVKQ